VICTTIFWIAIHKTFSLKIRYGPTRILSGAILPACMIINLNTRVSMGIILMIHITVIIIVLPILTWHFLPGTGITGGFAGKITTMVPGHIGIMVISTISISFLYVRRMQTHWTRPTRNGLWRKPDFCVPIPISKWSNGWAGFRF